MVEDYYAQFGREFVPWLSIIDVLMFNSLDAVRESVTTNYDLIFSDSLMPHKGNKNGQQAG